MDKLQQYTDDITEHAAQCAGSIELNQEGREGLASTFTGVFDLSDVSIQ